MITTDDELLKRLVETRVELQRPRPRRRPSYAMISVLVLGAVAGAAITFTAFVATGSYTALSASVVPSPSEPGGAIDPSSLAEALDTVCPEEDSDTMNCHWTGGENAVGTSILYVEGHRFTLDAVLATEGN